MPPDNIKRFDVLYSSIHLTQLLKWILQITSRAQRSSVRRYRQQSWSSSRDGNTAEVEGWTRRHLLVYTTGTEYRCGKTPTRDSSGSSGRVRGAEKHEIYATAIFYRAGSPDPLMRDESHFIIKGQQSVADLHRQISGSHPLPVSSIFFIFMQFLGKFGHTIG